MTRNESRTESMREQNTREEEWTFEEPNALDIPETVQARFENEGMALRWIQSPFKVKMTSRMLARRCNQDGCLKLQMKFPKWLSHPS